MDPFHERGQFPPPVPVHLRHMRRIPEVEKCRIVQRLIRHVRSPESVIRPRVMQKDPDNARKRQHNRIRRAAVPLQHAGCVRSVCFENPANHIPESVAARFPHEPDIRSEQLHGKPGIRDAAAGVKIRRARLDQAAGRQDFTDPVPSVRKRGRNIQADMPRRNDLFAHLSPSRSDMPMRMRGFVPLRILNKDL